MTLLNSQGLECEYSIDLIQFDFCLFHFRPDSSNLEDNVAKVLMLAYFTVDKQFNFDVSVLISTAEVLFEETELIEVEAINRGICSLSFDF